LVELTNVSEMLSASLINLISEVLVFCPELTQLVAREDFVEFSHHEIFRS
jgi:hypothetical protein